MLFNEALGEDLHEYRVDHPNIVLLQYVDDLMLAATTEEAFLEAIGNLLQTLGALEATNGLPIQKTGLGGYGVATLPLNHCHYCPPGP